MIRAASASVVAAWVVNRRQTIEDSFLSDGEALECLAATALIAACSVMQLVQGRGEAGSALPASRVFSPAEISRSSRR